MEKPVALITGAGSGIGRAAALLLAENGYRVALVGRTRQSITDTARAAGQGLIIQADVSRSADAAAAVQRTVEEFARLDALVHCAGLAPQQPIAAMSDADWHAVIDTNLSSAFYLLKAAWPAFAHQNSGVMVNISSMATRDPFPHFAAYAAAKSGLNFFGLCAAREGAAIGLRVHTLAPAAVETAMLRKLATPEQLPADQALAAIDIARVIVQCVQGDLGHTSGEVIYLHKPPA